jgi:hypothetical protein
MLRQFQDLAAAAVRMGCDVRRSACVQCGARDPRACCTAGGQPPTKREVQGGDSPRGGDRPAKVARAEATGDASSAASAAAGASAAAAAAAADD